jgi:hypothetical protein
MHDAALQPTRRARRLPELGPRSLGGYRAAVRVRDDEHVRAAREQARELRHDGRRVLAQGDVRRAADARERGAAHGVAARFEERAEGREVGRAMPGAVDEEDGGLHVEGCVVLPIYMVCGALIPTSCEDNGRPRPGAMGTGAARQSCRGPRARQRTRRTG